MRNLIKTINETNKNYVFSPAAIYYALLLLAQITGSETKKEITNAIEVGEDNLLNKAKEIYSKLNSDLEDNKVMLNSSLWLNKDIEVLNDSINQIAENNHTSIKSGEMGSDAFDKEIQRWINRNTRNLLKDSVDNIHTFPTEILDLITTAYLKASWCNGFQIRNTKKSNFFTLDGNTEKCNFMNGLLCSEELFAGKNFTAIKLFLNTVGYITFVLPNKEFNVNNIKNDEDLIDCLNGDIENLDKKIYDIDVSIPKFDIKADANIFDQFKRLGITSVFADKADFSPISSKQQIFLSGATQASRIKIDENGVEAASCIDVPGFAGGFNQLERTKFILDRPFMFSLVCNDIPLFVGTVTNPNK